MKDKAQMFIYYWRILKPKEKEPTPEYRFMSERRFRFDFAFPEHYIAVEVDGGQWTTHGGRHARDTDRGKMNLAASLGWRVFRFSPQMLERDPKWCIDIVAETLKNGKCKV